MNISNYYFADHCIKHLTKNLGLQYYDMQIQFSQDKDKPIGLTQTFKLNVGNPSNVNSIIYNIIYSYIKDLQKIIGKQIKLDKKNLYIYFLNLLRTFSTKTKSNKQLLGSINLTRIYKFSPVWNALSNIICPIYNIQLQDMAIIYGKSDKSDYSVIGNNQSIGRFICLNTDLVYEPVRDAFSY